MKCLGYKDIGDRYLQRQIEAPNMVEPKYIDEVLKQVNIETTRKSSCRMEKNWASSVLTHDEKN